MTRATRFFGPLGLAAAASLFAACASFGSRDERINDSGGALDPEQAAYDVLEYDLELAVDPDRSSIEGVLTMRARVVAPLERLVVDLDTRLEVERVAEAGRELAFAHRDSRIYADLGALRRPGEELELRVEYGGEPRTAPRPPWEGGFTWSRTQDGRPWIATSNQGEGGDLWWPCKDHPSDEPESMGIHVTVPAPLVCASNGRLERVDEDAKGLRTFHWRVSTPINNYTVALNIAPYETIEREYRSTCGDFVPVYFWVLPENRAQGETFIEEILAHLRFLEERFGPYPFRADKYGVVETPYLGMEHQTIIAYGNEYREDEGGYDWLHFHELAHEWWANMVTAPDWSEFWIHEGFATYAESLYTEQLQGAEAYRSAMVAMLPRVMNVRPVAPRGARTSGEMYFLDLDVPAGERKSDSDIYFKGAWALHTLRYLVGDEDFFRLLRRMAYPDPALEAVTDGGQCRFATTDDFHALAEELTGMELDWFFEVYLRQPELPLLESERRAGQLHLRWKTPANLPFPMPVELRAGGETRRIAVPAGGASVELPEGVDYALDPDAWILAVQPPVPALP